MSTESVGTNFPVYVTGDTQHPRALIVLQEAFGVTRHIREVCDDYGQQGFFVVAPHLFHREGSPEIAYDDFPSAMASLGQLTREGLTNDLNATTAFLNGLGYQKEHIGVVGYCMGGSVSFYANTLGTVGATISYYGGGVETGRFGLPSLLELAPQLQAPWLGLYGDQDQGIPVEQVDQLRAATDAAAVDTELVLYEGGQHGFNCTDRPAVFDATIAANARERSLTFFNAHLAAK